MEEEKKIMHYSSSQKILLVGEGNFSFAACLATAFGSANNTVATSLDSRGITGDNLLRLCYTAARIHVKDIIHFLKLRTFYFHNVVQQSKTVSECGLTIKIIQFLDSF